MNKPFYTTDTINHILSTRLLTTKYTQEDVDLHDRVPDRDQAGGPVSHQDWGWAAVLLGAAALGLGLAWMGHGGAEPLVVLLGGCAVWCYLQWENTA